MLKNLNSDILILNTQEERYQAARLASLAIAASGTVALELAIVDVPHLVAYKVPALTAFIARHFTNIKFVNLTNILLDKQIVPELLQEQCTKENLYNVSKLLLSEDTSLHKKEKEGFELLRQNLGFGILNPSQKAAEVVISLIKQNG